jgi:hypothetical protein
MTFLTLEDQVLKTDTLGRVRTPVERREALLDEFEGSGMSGVKFAGRIGIKYQTFASWVQMRRRRRAAGAGPLAASGPPLQWVEAVLDEGSAAAGCGAGALSVLLPGGARLHIGDARQTALAARLLHALAREAAC